MHYFELNFSKILKKIQSQSIWTSSLPTCGGGSLGQSGSLCWTSTVECMDVCQRRISVWWGFFTLIVVSHNYFFYSFLDWSRTQYFFCSARATLSPPAAKLCGRHQPRTQGAALFPLSSASLRCVALCVRPRVPTWAAIDTFLFCTALCFSIELEMSHFVCLVTVRNPPHWAWASQSWFCKSETQ